MIIIASMIEEYNKFTPDFSVENLEKINVFL